MKYLFEVVSNTILYQLNVFWQLSEIKKSFSQIVLYAGVFLHMYQSMRLKKWSSKFQLKGSNFTFLIICNVILLLYIILLLLILSLCNRCMWLQFWRLRKHQMITHLYFIIWTFPRGYWTFIWCLTSQGWSARSGDEIHHPNRRCIDLCMDYVLFVWLL